LYKHIPFGFLNLTAIWDKINDEKIKMFGHDPAFESYIKSVIHLAKLECDCILNPTPLNKATRAMKIEELKDKTNNKKVTYTYLINEISKRQGYPMWKVSTEEFYAALNSVDHAR
jgi:hypothetical protein